MNRHRFFVLLRLALSITAVVLIVEFLLLPSLHKNKTNLNKLVHVSVGYLLVGLGLEVLSLMAYAKLTQVVLPGRRVRYLTLLRIDMSTFAISHLLPGGSVAGAALGYRLLDAEDVSYTDATFALGTQGIGSAMVLNVIFWAALILSIPLHGVSFHAASHQLGNVYKAGALVGVLLLSFSGGLIFFLTIGQDSAARAVHWIAQKTPLVKADRIEQAIRRLAEHLAALARERGMLVRAILWAAANWGLDAAALWVFLRAFGVSVLPPFLLVAYGLAYVIAVIPITPGGLGFVESVLVLVLAGFGFHSSGVGLAVISYRVVNFLLPIPAGGLCYLSLTVHRAMVDTRAVSNGEGKPGRRAKKLAVIGGEIRDDLKEVVETSRRPLPGLPGGRSEGTPEDRARR